MEKQMNRPKNFKDFISFLNGNDVCYLLVGRWAVGIYGYPGETKDIDFLITNDEKNLKNYRKLPANSEHRRLTWSILRK